MSDILIKGMEMPVACFDCPCMQDLSNIDEEYYICAAIEHAPEITDKNNGRLPKCPIVEVPTPHGRLIDADELLKVIEENSYRLRGVINSTENGMFLSGIRQAIDEAPTIIEAEVSKE